MGRPNVTTDAYGSKLFEVVPSSTIRTRDDILTRAHTLEVQVKALRIVTNEQSEASQDQTGQRCAEDNDGDKIG